LSFMARRNAIATARKKAVVRDRPASALILVLLAFGCAAAPVSKKFVKVFLPDGFAVSSELAVTDEERQRGLMFREKLNPDQGMLFLFAEEGAHSFWMKNMRFAIDILWLDKGKRIVHIEPKAPPCPAEPCPSYDPGAMAMYVLELDGGAAQKHGLKLHDRLDFILPKNLRAART
jgi:uncharacterized membrane protein (UPF0127 family)